MKSTEDTAAEEKAEWAEWYYEKQAYTIFDEMSKEQQLLLTQYCNG